jgi:hypothetical protein
MVPSIDPDRREQKRRPAANPSNIHTGKGIDGPFILLCHDGRKRRTDTRSLPGVTMSPRMPTNRGSYARYDVLPAVALATAALYFVPGKGRPQLRRK